MRTTSVSWIVPLFFMVAMAVIMVMVVSTVTAELQEVANVLDTTFQCRPGETYTTAECK